MKPKPSHSINFKALLDLADTRTVGRGYSYFESGAVSELRVTERSASATVYGSELYEVRIDNGGGEPSFSCSCPMGERGVFCKHLVAVVLAWEKVSEGVDDEQPLRSELLQRSVEELVDIIEEQCVRDESFRRELKVKLSKFSASGLVDIRAMEELLRQSFTIRDFVDYRGAYEQAQKMERALDVLAKCVEQDGGRCVDLVESAARLADGACLSMDDSDGHMNFIFRQIEGLHIKACKLAAEPPTVLAERLFRLATEASFCQFWDCWEKYRELLGAEGQSHLQSLFQAVWNEIPARRPVVEDLNKTLRERYKERRNKKSEKDHPLRSVTTHFMMIFAGEDLDAKVAVLQRDLEYPGCIERICRMYRESGRLEEALSWAKEGLKLFESGHKENLFEELREIYVALGRLDEAIELCWDRWSRRPGIDAFKRLCNTSQLAGARDLWRTRAYEFIWARVLEEASRRAGRTVDGSTASAQLVEMLLWENRLEEAWEVSQTYGCATSHLMPLARYREKKAPLDAVPIYQSFVESDLARRDPTTYARIAEDVEHICALLKRAGESKMLVDYESELRKEYKRLRNFMKALDERTGIAELVAEAGGRSWVSSARE